MDHRVEPVAPGWEHDFALPPSKSVHQRALVLAALCESPPELRAFPGARPPGDDVRRCAEAVAALGTWTDGALGASRETRVLDLGESGTALRFLLALACLRPAGARTLLRARPVLLRRPHAPLRRALVRLGAHVKRRSSGALRVLGSELQHGARLTLDVRRSSQYASALALIAPRIGGLTLELVGGHTSRPYLDLTLAMLADAGIGVQATTERVGIAAGVPRRETIDLPADASAAACWWTAAALTGGRARVPGLARDGRQADLAMLDILATHGAAVEADAGAVTVSGGTQPAADARREHDLTACPDLMFLVGALAARTPGVTVLRGLAHTRGKESDRVAVLVAGLQALGVDAAVEPGDVVCIRGGGARGGLVSVAGDHRAAFGFGVLGLAVPGVTLRGAEVAAKSQPRFLADLAALATQRSET